MTHAAKNRGLNLNIDGNAESCADLKVRSTGEIAQVNEAFTLSKGEAPILELNAAERGQIRVRGWDRADYSVETCKIAAADTRGAAEQMARGISVAHSAGRISYNGPASESAEWTAVFIVHAPRDASLNLEAKNGPIEVRGVNGSVKLRASNGPIAIADCGGSVEAHTTNGPIAFSGDRGEVHLNAQNGPIAVNLTTEKLERIATGSAHHQRAAGGFAAGELPLGNAAGDCGTRADFVQRGAVPQCVEGRPDDADERLATTPSVSLRRMVRWRCTANGAARRLFEG